MDKETTLKRFNQLPEREQKIILAVAWIKANDHFLFPLEGESDIRHHARILTAYAHTLHANLEAENARLAAKLERAMEGLEHYADRRQWLCPFNRKLCQDDDCFHDQLWLPDDDGNGYDRARQAIEEIKIL